MAETYRLETLLTLRRREEEAAKEALAAAMRELEQGKARRAESEAALAASKQRLRDAQDQALQARCVADGTRGRAFVERRRSETVQAERALETARGAEAQAGKAAQAARDRLGERIRAREEIERHKAEWLEERRRAADRREEEILDELATASAARKGDDA